MFSFLKFSLYLVFSNCNLGFEGGEAIFEKKLIRILTRKKESKLKEDMIRVVDKLRKQERLTDGEFWRVYESIRQEGPEVKYQNPQNWVRSGE
jgi:hypothetical protein